MMPQALDSQRELMGKWFGNEIDDGGPYAFLRSHGYWEEGGMIRPPVPHHNVSADEWQCIAFLCDEWDYGWETAKD